MQSITSRLFVSRLFMSRLFILIATACLASLQASADASWPNQVVKVIVPYTPGGGTDTIARQLLEKITNETKWTMIVDNRPGGAGNIGLSVLAKSAPDGYTLGIGQTANLAINPALIAKMPFDPNKDFIPISLIAEQPTLLVVTSESSFKNFADLVRTAKAKPGDIKQGLAGNGTVGHLAGEMLAHKAGLKFLNVPYKGAAPAVTDLLGGQTDFMFATPPSVLGLIKKGRLRVLAVTSATRLSTMPDIPTVAELGYKGFEAVDWKMLIAPAGTPAAIVKQLNEAVEKAMNNPALQAQFAAEGSTRLGGSPQRAIDYLKSEQAEWTQLIRAANIKIDP